MTFPSDELGLNKKLEDVRGEVFNHLDESHAEYVKNGFLPTPLNLNRGPIRGLIELGNWGLYRLYKFFYSIMPQAFPLYAEGAWMDVHAAQVGLSRKEAIKARGRIMFYRHKNQGNVRVPKGRLIRTKPDGQGLIYRFVTLDDVVIQDGQTEAAVMAEAEEYGRAANVGPGMICELVNSVAGVDGVKNAADWLTVEGADAEDDESLRARYILAWKGLSGLNKYFYEFLALSVPGVVAARIADQHPRGQGTVDVIVRGAAGLPTENLIKAVEKVIEAERPQNDDVLVKAPRPVPVDLRLTLEHVSGSAADIVSEVENRLRALFIYPETIKGLSPLDIGEDLTHSRLIAEAMKTAGVKKVTVTDPAADLNVDDDALAVLNSIALETVLVKP